MHIKSKQHKGSNRLRPRLLEGFKACGGYVILTTHTIHRKLLFYSLSECLKHLFTASVMIYIKFLFFGLSKHLKSLLMSECIDICIKLLFYTVLERLKYLFSVGA